MSQICSKMVNFLLAASFNTIVTVKVKLIPDFYTWAIFLINYQEEIGEKQFFFFLSQMGVKIAP